MLVLSTITMVNMITILRWAILLLTLVTTVVLALARFVIIRARILRKIRISISGKHIHEIAQVRALALKLAELLHKRLKVTALL